jgi:hypothetical protein
MHRLTPLLTVSGCQPIGVKSPGSRTVTQQRLFSSSKKEQAPSDSSDNSAPPDAWVSILENTVSSPWLFSRPQTQERILQRAFTLILQIILSLNVPREPDAARAFFFVRSCFVFECHMVAESRAFCMYVGFRKCSCVIYF